MKSAAEKVWSIVEFFGLFELIFNLVVTILFIYQMNRDASTGFLGIYGVGVMAVLSATFLIAASYLMPDAKIRTFMCSTALVLAFFFYLIPVCLSSKPPHDATFQEVLKISQGV